MALVACLAFGFARPERAPLAMAAVTVLLVAMAFTQLEKFESIKGAGVEFKLRQAAEQAEKASAEVMATTEQAKVTTEQAKATTEAAKATTAELRSAASIVARLSLTLLARNLPVIERRHLEARTKLTEELEHALEDLGVPAEEVGDVAGLISAAVRHGHASGVHPADMAPCADTSLCSREGEAYEALERALSAIADQDPSDTSKTERYRAVVERIGARGPGIDDKLADYELYIERGRLRRPERRK